MKKVTMLIAFVFALSITAQNEASAQKFLKKIGNAIEKGAKAIDKATDDLLGTSSESSGKSSKGPIVPYLTENTKKIYVDGAGVFDLSFISCVDEGVFWVTEKNKGTFLYDTLGKKLDFDYGRRQFIKRSNVLTEVPRFHDGVAPFECLLENRGVDLMEKDGTVRSHIANVKPRTQFNNIGIAAGYITYDKRGNSKAFHLNWSDVVYYNTKGEIVLQNISMEMLNDPYLEVDIRNMYNNRMAFMDYGTKKWGFIDENFEIVVPAKYQAVLDFSDGMAAVQDATGNWGYIDKVGNTVISHIYSKRPGSFINGYARVEKRSGDDRYAFIDKKGNIIMDNINDVQWRMGGYTLITKRSDSGWDNIILDADLKMVHKGDCIHFVNFYSNDMWFTSDGAHDMYGNLLIKGCTSSFVNGLATMNYGHGNGTWRGFMRPNGEIAILFVEREF